MDLEGTRNEFVKRGERMIEEGETNLNDFGTGDKKVYENAELNR